MATINYEVLNEGNLAIQTEVWSIPIIVCKLVANKLDANRVGSYWHSTLKKPINIARRHKQNIVRVYTSGFTTGQLANALSSIGFEHKRV